jgi:phage recombination protein Bet
MSTAAPSTAVVVARPRLPMPQGETDLRRWRVLTDAIFPNARSPDSIMLALDYCRVRNLDVMKRPVNIVPMYDERQRKYIETIWPSINETQITAARTNEWAGMDVPLWGEDRTEGFTDDKNHTYKVTFPEWCAVTVYRIVKGQRCPFVEPVFWLEACARTAGGVPNAMWRKRPRGQVAKVAKAASLRAAFPEESAGPIDDEMDGQTVFDNLAEAAEAAPQLPEGLPEIGQPQHNASAMDELIDQATGEVIDHVTPFTIELSAGKTWGDFIEPLTRYILHCHSIEEYDEWRLKNQDLLIKLKESKPQLFKLFEKNIEAKYQELIAT